MTTTQGRHRRTGRGQRCPGALSLAGVAMVAATAIGLTPSVALGTRLLADAAVSNSYFVRGTRIGSGPSEADYVSWADKVLTSTVGAHNGPTNVPYSAAFWPVSSGFFSDLTFGASVHQGLDALTGTIASAGDSDQPVIIYGYSQGAVVVTEYLRAHPDSGNTYVLVGNPNRPNGGILQRFNGLYIPILNVPFNGSTPTDGDTVIDVAYRYDGWADFPKYPLNLVATANALVGIAVLHGKADRNINAETLAAAQISTHGTTTYYLLNSDHVPLLMLFDGIVPDSILDALDKPLRAIIESAYDRSDYGVPTTAGLFPPLSPPTVATEVTAEPVSTVAAPAELPDQRAVNVLPAQTARSGAPTAGSEVNQAGTAQADSDGPEYTDATLEPETTDETTAQDDSTAEDNATTPDDTEVRDVPGSQDDDVLSDDTDENVDAENGADAENGDAETSHEPSDEPDHDPTDRDPSDHSSEPAAA